MQSPSSKITLREDGKLATTTYGNEIASRVNAMIESPDVGARSRDIRQSILVVAKVTGPQDERRGWYNGRTIFDRPNPTAEDQDSGQKLELLDFGEVGDKDNITLWSPGEVLGGPMLAMGGVVVAVLYGYDADTQELGIVLNATGFFPVLVKWSAGTDGSGTTMASYTYDLYDGWDSTFLNKINPLAIQPTRSAARTQFGKVTKASDGSVGSAYIDSTGTIKLWDCQEIRAAAEVCT